MTVNGEQKLRAELDHLKKVERPRITKAIAEARAHGDLKENAEYHAAREQQSFAEGRIQEIESKLSQAQVIDITKMPVSDKVIFGTTVTLINVETDATTVYKIVGDDEANVKEGRISVNSPIARGLVGKNEGDVVAIQTPSGVAEYEIDQVQYL
jgi:transcription elongation factor GreA